MRLLTVYTHFILRALGVGYFCLMILRTLNHLPTLQSLILINLWPRPEKTNAKNAMKRKKKRERGGGEGGASGSLLIPHSCCFLAAAPNAAASLLLPPCCWVGSFPSFIKLGVVWDPKTSRCAGSGQKVENPWGFCIWGSSGAQKTSGLRPAPRGWTLGEIRIAQSSKTFKLAQKRHSALSPARMLDAVPEFFLCRVRDSGRACNNFAFFRRCSFLQLFVQIWQASALRQCDRVVKVMD